MVSESRGHLQLASLLGQVTGASSGSTKVTWLPEGVKRLKDSISWGTPDIGQLVTRMLRAYTHMAKHGGTANAHNNGIHCCQWQCCSACIAPSAWHHQH